MENVRQAAKHMFEQVHTPARELHARRKAVRAEARRHKWKHDICNDWVQPVISLKGSPPESHKWTMWNAMYKRARREVAEWLRERGFDVWGDPLGQ